MPDVAAVFGNTLLTTPAEPTATWRVETFRVYFCLSRRRQPIAIAQGVAVGGRRRGQVAIAGKPPRFGASGHHVGAHSTLGADPSVFTRCGHQIAQSSTPITLVHGHFVSFRVKHFFRGDRSSRVEFVESL